MKTLLVTLAAATCLAAQAGARIEKLADGVYASIRTEPPGLFFDSNVVFVEGERDVLVVDANFSLASARANLAELRKITSKPVRYVVNTHWHDDHITGNRVWRDAYPGVEFVGHTSAAADMAGVGETNRQGLRANAANFAAALRKRVAEGTSLSKAPITDEERASYGSDAGLIDQYLADVPQVEIIEPTLAVESRLVLQQGKRTVEILHLGAGHSRADLVVWLPQERIAITGDLVVWPVPLVGSTSFPSAFAATLEKLVALRPAVMVPGHGPVMRDDAYARQVVGVLRSITEQTRAAVAKGETLEQARKSVDLEAHRRAFAGESAARHFIFDGYVAGPGVAAAYEEAKAAYAPRADGKAFRALARRFTGEWDCHIRELEENGTLKWEDRQLRRFSMTVGGFFLQEAAIARNAKGAEYTSGLHLTSFDEATAEVLQEGYWGGTAGPLFRVRGRMEPASGRVDAQMEIKVAGGGTETRRVEIEWLSDTRHAYRAFRKGKDGREYLVEELTYTRRDPAG